jgi:phage-related protein
MTRTLVATLLLALLAAPMALAQHGPPPGYDDPTEYAQDYAKQQVGNATADPLGYAQGLDAGAEAEHALWLACWEAYEATGHALDAACAPFFTAPVTVEPAAKAIEADVTQVLNDTGTSALADDLLDIANDTVADPTSALDQVGRAVDAVVRFVEDLLGFLKDTVGLALLAVAAGVLGAVQGIVDLAALPLDGLALAGDGLVDLGGALAEVLGLIGTGTATASSAAGGAALDAASAVVGAVQAAAGAAADGALAAGDAIASALLATVDGVRDAGAAAGDGALDAVGAVASGVGDGAQALADGVAQAADAVRDGVNEALDRVGALFDSGEKESAKDRAGLPGAPKTGTGVDGLLDDVLDSV